LYDNYDTLGKSNDD